jgi:hypothetical protein
VTNLLNFIINSEAYSIYQNTVRGVAYDDMTPVNNLGNNEDRVV